MNNEEALRKFLNEVGPYNYREAKYLIKKFPKPGDGFFGLLLELIDEESESFLNNVYAHDMVKLLLIIHYPHILNYQTLIRFYGSSGSEIQNLARNLIQEMPTKEFNPDVLKEMIGKDNILIRNLARQILMIHFPEKLTIDELKKFRDKSGDELTLDIVTRLLSEKGEKSQIRKKFEECFPSLDH